MADIFNFTDLWTVGGTTYDAIKVDVTDTASAAASLLLNLSVGGSVKFSVRKDGHVVAATEAIGGATIGTNALAVTGTAFISNYTALNGGTYINTSGGIGTSEISLGNTTRAVTVGSTGEFSFSSTTNASTGVRDAVLSRNAAGIIQFGTTAANAFGAWFAAKGTLTGGTLADQAQVLAITATQPASPTNTQAAINVTVTGAGSASQVNIGTRLSYAAGYTGSALSISAATDNASLGTGNILVPASGSNSAAGNVGQSALVNGLASGINMGFLALVEGSNTNVGFLGLAQIAKTGAGTKINIGVVGSAYNAVTGGSTPVQIGGFFSLNQTSVPSVSAALIADNGAQSDAVALFRVAGVTNVSVSGTGLLVQANATDSTTTTSGALQVAGGMAVRKRVFIDGITASAGLQQAVLCQSSGGEMIADSVACLASSERFKKLLGIVESGAIDKIIRLPIQRWKYNEEGIFKSDDWTRERIGPTAEDVEAIDSRLVGYDTEGKPRNISQEQLLALAIQAIQEQQVQIEDLKARPWAH